MAKPDRFAHDFCEAGSRAPPSLPIARQKLEVLRNMPARFLTAEQRRCYGCFPDKLSADALARHFHLDATDRTVIQGLRDPQNRLGFAVQLGTVRLLGRSPDRFTDLPLGVIRANGVSARWRFFRSRTPFL